MSNCGQVDVWSDYLRARFHPRTNVILEEYQHGNPLKVVSGPESSSQCDPILT